MLGNQELTTGLKAAGALNVVGTRYASTAAWPQKLPRLQLSGTMKPMLPRALLILCQLRAESQQLGAVTSVVTSGSQRFTAAPRPTEGLAA